jgi:hypothetical protein
VAEFQNGEIENGEPAEPTRGRGDTSLGLACSACGGPIKRPNQMRDPVSDRRLHYHRFCWLIAVCHDAGHPGGPVIPLTECEVTIERVVYAHALLDLHHRPCAWCRRYYTPSMRSLKDCFCSIPCADAAGAQEAERLAPRVGRVCSECGVELDPDTRMDAVTCSPRCRQRRRRARRSR